MNLPLPHFHGKRFVFFLSLRTMPTVLKVTSSPFVCRLVYNNLRFFFLSSPSSQYGMTRGGERRSHIRRNEKDDFCRRPPLLLFLCQARLSQRRRNRRTSHPREQTFFVSSRSAKKNIHRMYETILEGLNLLLLYHGMGKYEAGDV